MKIVDKDSASFGLPTDREVVLSLSGDHSGICKFASEQDSDYEFVQNHIMQLVKDALAAQQTAMRLAELGQTSFEGRPLYELASM